MTQRYPNGTTQSSYSFLNQQSSAQASGPPPNGLPPRTFPPSQTLPPLATAPYVSTNDHHDYPRLSSLLMTSQAEAAGQPGAFPVYAPTGNIYFNQNYGSSNASPDNFQRPQSIQSSGPPPSHMQTLAHAQPAYTATSRSLPDIAPMPPRSLRSILSVFGSDDSLSQPEEINPPSHVVGAQGRRGILPSAAGRPPAVVDSNGDGQKGMATPAKDEHGKYPCPHCDKSYLHAKHLKRHMLRREYRLPVRSGLN